MSVLKGSYFKSVEIVDRSIQVKFSDGTEIGFEDCWLRDHCRCSACYRHESNQRAIHVVDIPDSRIADIRFDETKIVITWDDNHESSYVPDFLVQFDYRRWIDGRRLRPKLWAGPGVATKAARVQAAEFLASETEAKRVFQSLLDYGFAIIEGVEPNLKGTEPVCQALGGVMHTKIYGGMWEISSRANLVDTAYTTLGLAAHQDNTYFTESAGLQVLHCFEHTGTGAENFLVDGFYGATLLRKEHPEDFEFLTKVNNEAEYVEGVHHHRHSGPVIFVNTDTQDLVQIRYNAIDRTPMAFESGEKCRSYYRAMRNLGRYYQDPSNCWQIKLWPGTALVYDNFRLLHGRTAFTGTRTIGGSYVSRSDWLDRARVLGLIV